MSLSPIQITPAAQVFHANVQPVSSLVGDWHGSTGSGIYPSIQPFRFEEDISFEHSGKVFIMYTSRTFLAGSSRTKPMHSENGFLRLVGERRVEALITQCTGVQEILAGEYVKDDAKQNITITLDSTSLARTPSAKQPHVTATRRVYTVDLDGDNLEYKIYMSTTTTPELTLHLSNKFTHTQKLGFDSEEDVEEEEKLEDLLMEPEVERHHMHNHSRGHSRAQSNAEVAKF